MKYSERIKHTTNPTAQNLFRLMDEKKTNLSLAVDVTTKSELILLADLVGPEICILKTHIDIVEDYDNDLIIKLQHLSEKHNFLIFEDRKFADIGNTVKHQYQDGVYHIADWAHITNAHTVPGSGIIAGLREVGMPKGRGLLLLAEMSSKGNLATGDYTQESLKMAEEHKDFVIGFITMRKLLDDPGFINMTPGVNLQTGTDNLGQQFKTPDLVIRENESDIIIVGRGIYEADDPITEAQKYRTAGWQAYQRRLL
ncbi:MAG: orotidine-5'-phosphate decarboxylase [Candidatus Magasanikbacteria bacterium CG_4_10_14_0_2_um_filter_37_12]|uniref:Orotidine 5'-phosphate decarboxylase n=1 Tax=Candidatus Magasanikbacteria bacterium CG_4_10_14_0_2_um_filter_37_12 TaxID=1974637 RepID=A0A2M7V840_9BACT|nr:MAG: orotidine-5'-phosphate decarboxylase [Candidatus Magasanikbacteria bacterium CG_4_10_14_0_2_um_filter_37_12]